MSLPQAPGPVSESLQGRNPRAIVLERAASYGDLAAGLRVDNLFCGGSFDLACHCALL
ncbi:MAG: hypothetical protein AAFW82_01220 [Pseudomonadota bacterium]